MPNKLRIENDEIVINDKPIGNLNLARWVLDELENKFGQDEFYLTVVGVPPNNDAWKNRMPVMRELSEEGFVTLYKAATIRGWISDPEVAAHLAMVANKAVPFANGHVPADANDLLLWANHDIENKTTTYHLVY
ncbi:hypothetical protein LRU95_002348 [Salmonella enterica]|nr:hypothetical protein [Salmonella enterica]